MTLATFQTTLIILILISTMGFGATIFWVFATLAGMWFWETYFKN